MKTQRSARADRKAPSSKKRWTKPSKEEVSNKVMAQPYIRFT